MKSAANSKVFVELKIRKITDTGLCRFGLGGDAS
jgi:hypothetical protein